MKREDRAKQFMPFDAVKGLRKSLRLKEIEKQMVKKKELSEDSINEICGVLRRIERNSIVTVCFFCEGHYETKTGKARVVVEKNLLEVDEVRIDFFDIYKIQIIENRDD